MPKNLEIKVKLQSHNKIKSILKKNGIYFSDSLIQKDIYYKIKKGLLKLRIENGKQTLIFYDRNEKSKKRWSNYHLLEINKINGNIFLKKFLNVLVTVDKKRELYLFNDTRIHLDSVKNLGCFLELETKVINGLKNAEKRFDHLLDLLELRNKVEIRASYKDLLLSKKQK